MIKSLKDKLQNEYELIETTGDENGKVRVWVSKNNKINIDLIYELMIASHKQRAEVLNDGM